MSNVEENEELGELYTAKDAKNLLGIKESVYRTTLRDYKKYISTRKGEKNKDLYTGEGLEILGCIIRLRKWGYSKEEIVREIKKLPAYINTRVKDNSLIESENLREIMNSNDVPELVSEFVDRMCRTNRDMNSLRKTLDKRTENYKKEISDLETKLNETDKNAKESVSKLLKTVWSLEKELNDYKNETILTKMKRLFGFR